MRTFFPFKLYIDVLVLYSHPLVHCSFLLLDGSPVSDTSCACSLTFDNVNREIGQAFVIFKTKEAAKRAIKKLDTGCLVLPDGRYV